MSAFVDECQLNVRGGDGGAGAVSFRREAHVPRGGPDGGDGGRGGDVWLVADHNVASLLDFRDHPHRRATSGRHGSGKKRHGTAGDDLEVRVPEGTVVYDRDRKTVLADLVASGDRWLAAAGGQGGRGNARFLSNRRRAPGFAEQGEAGEERWLHLELKLMADVALVGFPNAGKSTLVSRVSAARPKIADYPFTTLEPHLGVVRVGDGTDFVMADVPGLLEGASDGRGLGHQFLRHVERARVLVVLCDLAPVDARSPADQEAVLLAELEAHRPELAERPRVVVGSKVDVLDREAAEQAGWGPWLGSHALVSAVTGQGIDELVGRLARAVAEARASAVTRESFVVHRPEPEDVRVERDDDGSFVVMGRAARRAVALSDLTDPQALEYAQSRLEKLGVNRALERAGARVGDTVRIGSLEFDFRPDGD